MKRLFVVFAVFSGLSFTAAHGAEAGALVPSQLRCEYAVDPLGVDVAQPRLSWRVQSSERGQRQTAWQVLVASSAELLAADHGDLWDSGRVETDATTHLRYAGAALTSSQQVFWKVRVWDRGGKASPWSTPATWTMGLLAPTDWKGAWITSSAGAETLLLRGEFDVKPGLRRALVYVCGLGEYEADFNGTKAGTDLLAPGWTNFNKTTLYDTYNVTALLRTGRNAAGLTLGNGMYHVVRRDNRFAKFTGSFGPLRATLHLRLEYADGSVAYFGTDAKWRTHAGPLTCSSIYGGEDFDARLVPAGWDRPGFDDHLWPAAVPVDRPVDTLRGQSHAAEPLRAIETRQAVAVRDLAPGVVLYDFGQNASFMPRLRVAGPAGSTVRMTPGEVVNADGTIDRGTMGGAHRGSAWWQYTKATDGEETWFPQFYYVGSRYLYTELIPPPPGGTPLAAKPANLPRIVALDDVIVHSSAAPVGQFACSNPLLNRIRDLVRWAQRSNMVSVLTDCPHREKLGWIEQYHLNGPSIRYEFDVARIFAKGMRDMAEAQTDEGLVPNIAPEYTEFKGAFRNAAEWGAAFLLVPWQQYEFTGDADLIRTNYDAMKRYFAFQESRAKDGILADGLGDWYDFIMPARNRPGLTPAPITATAFYFNNAQLLARMAGLLGRADE
ncbi:MAG TPA: family 78 glycoside hydrolase catalytic domain, partial [Opitutaceae bacterium]|nr:family 78 glycoside hydrolase catalytic domain [Opitutaceae bacterium]